MTEYLPNVEACNVSVVIPSYGYCPHLTEVIAALTNQTEPPLEIIVVHSGLHNPTSRLAAVNPNVKVIHRDVRTYAGPARNIGIAEGRGKWIAFLDSDVLPVRTWLAELVHAANEVPNRFVVGSLGYARSGGYWGLCLWAIEFSSIHPYLPGGEVQGGASANMLVPVEPLQKAGGFPENFEASEDSFLAANLREQGLSNWFCPEARGNHFNEGGVRHCLKHLQWLGVWAAICRQVKPLRGDVAVKFWPLSLGLWFAKLALITYRSLRWGTEYRSLFLLLLPGIVVGILAWNLGFFTGLQSFDKIVCAKRAVNSQPPAGRQNHGP